MEIFEGTWLSKELVVLNVQVASAVSRESILLTEGLGLRIRSFTIDFRSYYLSSMRLGSCIHLLLCLIKIFLNYERSIIL